jgi:membrane protease subunit HflK
LAVCLVLLYLCSGIYSVPSNKVGVLQRFGRIIGDRIQPGIHYMLPWPIDRVTKVPVKVVDRMLIDDFYSEAINNELSSNNFSNATGLDSYCLTGDNNLVNVLCVVQYTIVEPVKYLFQFGEPKDMLKSMACNTIIHCLAGRPIDEVLTRGKQEMVNYFKTELQKRLDAAGSGMNISFVEISSIKPPELVQDAFSDVVKANIDREKMINDAVAYSNEKIPAANADAARIVQEGRAYKAETVLKAEGDTRRFLSLLSETRKKSNSVQKMLYIETLTEIMKNVGEKHFMANDGSGKAPARLILSSPP